ncbi:MAG TPA: hypothetical protein VMU95_20225, partial [Trebonia sp.]|nr:hypothetical protein [Trebonia sp.]
MDSTIRCTPMSASRSSSAANPVAGGDSITLVSTWPARPYPASRSRSWAMRLAMTAWSPVPFQPVA